jgi:hypothetical protein
MHRAGTSNPRLNQAAATGPMGELIRLIKLAQFVSPQKALA